MMPSVRRKALLVHFNMVGLKIICLNQQTHHRLMCVREADSRHLYCSVLIAGNVDEFAWS